MIEKIKQYKKGNGKNESAIVDEGDEQDDSDNDNNTPNNKQSVDGYNLMDSSKKIGEKSNPTKKSS